MSLFDNPASAVQWGTPHEGVIAALLDDGRVIVTLDPPHGPVEATVSRPTATVRTTVEDLHSHGLEAADPTGTRCLVVFADGRQDRAWVVGFA